MIAQALAVALSAVVSAHDDGAAKSPPAVTWSRDIAPILRKNCETCHRPGQIGPFALQTYDQAKGWAEMIGSVVAEGRMPPWNADERYDGVFANERRLTKKEKEKLFTWIETGMLRGNPEEDPPPARWPEGWRVGEPDAVFTVEEFRGDRLFGEPRPFPEKGFEVPREGVVPYQYFAVKTDFPDDRWIRAMEVQPGAADVVHHVLVLIDDPNAVGEERQRQLDARSYLAGAAPGDAPTAYPEGYAKRLPVGATLIFQVHYTPNGKERYDRSRMGMLFWDEPPLFEVVTDGVMNLTFEIPPGAESYEVRSEIVLDNDTGIVSMSPHMHTRGKDFRYIAHYPDGTSEDLLLVDYDFNWQEIYILPDPLFLPGGTRLECIGHFDNSAANPNNPDPTDTVRWGDQTFEEMFIGYYDYVRPLDE